MTSFDVKLSAWTLVPTIIFLIIPTLLWIQLQILIINKENNILVVAKSYSKSKDEQQHQWEPEAFSPSLCWRLAWPWDDLPFSEPQLPVWLHTQPELGPSSSTHSVEGREKHVNSLQRALQLPTQDRDYAPKAAHNTSFWGKEKGRKEKQSWIWGSPEKNTRCWQQQILRTASGGGGDVHPSPHCPEASASPCTENVGRCWAGQSLCSVEKEQSK